jgi:hypothetical protein
MLRLGTAALLASLVSFGPRAFAQEGVGVGSDPNLTAAFQVAQSQIQGGQLIRARVEGSGSSAVYGFYFWQNGKIVEVEISQVGHQVKKKKEFDSITDVKDIDPDAVKLLSKKGGRTKLPEGRLFEIAGGAVKKGGISDFRYVMNGDRLAAQVGDILIDAETGKLVPKKK